MGVFFTEKRGRLLRMPVADDAPSAYDYRVKQTVVAVCTRTKLVFEHMVAALIAEQVFVIRRQQERLLSAASRAAILVDVVCCTVIFLLCQFVAERID